MSSINAHYTFKYSQPEGYRFSHDSVFLARRVFELEHTNLSRDLRLLDLCCGCGVVGLDFLFHARLSGQPLPQHCDFLDVQDVYREHFEHNVQAFVGANLNLSFRNENYTALAVESYDLILCNPPYFRAGQGRPSPVEFKNRCRFFIDASSSELWRAVARALKPAARAYLLVNEGSDHGIDSLQEIQSAVQEVHARDGFHVRVAAMGDIRGTPLVKLERLA